MDVGLPQVAMLALAGVVAGLFLLARGMSGFRTATRIADTGTSTISSLAAGEVRVSGVIEPAELTLVSPLQSRPCVFYRSSVTDGEEIADLSPEFEEERAVGFRVRDPSGSVRVFPRGARWDAPTYLDDRTGAMGDEPPGLQLRVGSAVGMADIDRATAIAALLSVRAPAGSADSLFLRGVGVGSGRHGSRRYRESRLAPGDAVTVVGRALPFADVSDPAEADIALGTEVAADDLEVSADLAEARAAGLLADTPEAAWGNAAIPGFGVGRPVRAPLLDRAARPLPLAPAEDAARIERQFTIAPEALVLASAPDVPLLIAYGVPGAAAGRHQDRFLVGLLGAILAIGSALALAWVVGGGLGP